MLDLTQGAVSEELDVVGQTELLHLDSRTLVNHRVLNLWDTQQTRMKTEDRDRLVEVEVEVPPGCLRCRCLCW